MRRGWCRIGLRMRRFHRPAECTTLKLPMHHRSVACSLNMNVRIHHAVHRSIPRGNCRRRTGMVRRPEASTCTWSGRNSCLLAGSSRLCQALRSCTGSRPCRRLFHKPRDHSARRSASPVSRSTRWDSCRIELRTPRIHPATGCTKLKRLLPRTSVARSWSTNGRSLRAVHKSNPRDNWPIRIRTSHRLWASIGR